MWISNTATTSMMLPILEAVLEQLREMSKTQNDDDAKLRKDSFSAESTPKANKPGTESTEYEHVPGNEYSGEGMSRDLSVCSLNA